MARMTPALLKYTTRIAHAARSQCIRWCTVHIGFSTHEMGYHVTYRTSLPENNQSRSSAETDAIGVKGKTAVKNI